MQEFVATSALCCSYVPFSAVRVTAGEHLLDANELTEQHRRAAEVHVHESFDYATLDNNICLIKVDAPFDTGR